MTKKFLLGLSVLPVTLAPIAFVAQDPTPPSNQNSSGSTNAQQGQSGTSNTDANSNQQAKKPDPKPIDENDLKSNKEWWEQNRAKLIDGFINQVKKDIDNKLASIFSKTRDNLEQRLSQSFFWLQLKHYFDSNQKQIEQDPMAFGLNILTPYIYSNNINLKQGDVKFGKDDFNGIEWGQAEHSDYSKIPNVKVDNVKDTKNTLKGEEFQERIKNYFAQLSSGYQTYLFKEDEFPKYKENFTLKLNTTGKEANTILESQPKGKPGISSWFDWIKNYFEKQSLLLDLSLNQLPNPSSSQSPQIQIDSALKDVDLNVPPQTSQKPEFEIRIAPDLSPILHWDLIKQSPQNVVNLFNSANDTQKQRMFFFLNPIHSRFKYKVESLQVDNNKLKASVKITDNVEKSKPNSTPEKYEKKYSIGVYDDFLPTDSLATKAILTRNLWISNQGVSKVVDDFFSSVNVQGDFKFDDIKNYSVVSQNLIYNFFYLITKVFYNQTFLDAQKQLVRNYISGPDSRLFAASQSQFIDFLQKSVIDSNKALEYYSLIYYTQLLSVHQALAATVAKVNNTNGNKDQNKQVQDALKKLAISKSEVDRMFGQAREQNLLLRQTIHKINPNLISHFSEVVDYGRKLNQASQLLGQIAFFNKNTQQNSGNQNSKTKGDLQVQSFTAMLNKYNSEQSQNYNKNIAIYTVVAAIIAALAATVVASRSFILKRSKK